MAFLENKAMGVNQLWGLTSSYTTWNSSLSATMLASKGFRYTGVSDTVECISCHSKISDWRETDSIDQRHSQASPNCEYVKSSDQGHLKNITNTYVPAHVNNTTTKAAIQSDSTVCNRPKELVNTHSHRNEHKKTSMLVPTQSEYRLPVPVKFNEDGSYRVKNSNTMDTPDGLNEVQTSEPKAKIPQHQSETARLATYENWPDSAHVKPPMLARAGLFYTGTGDKVKCPFCLGSMYNWEQGDVPLNEHNKHYPDCSFVKYKIYQSLYPNSVGQQQQTVPVIDSLRQQPSRAACASPVAGQRAPSSDARNHNEDSSVPVVTSTNQQVPATKVVFEELNAVKIVSEMGYSMKMMRQAVRRITNYSPLSLKSGVLLDAVFALENEGYDSNEEEGADSEVYANNDPEELLGATARPPQIQPDYAAQQYPAASTSPDLQEDSVSAVSPTAASDNLTGGRSLSGYHQRHDKSLGSKEVFLPASNPSPPISLNNTQSSSPTSQNTLEDNPEQRSDSHIDSSSSAVLLTRSTSPLESSHLSLGSQSLSPNSNPIPKPKKKTLISQNPEYKKLSDEHQKLIQNKICHECKTDPVSILFLPCRHLICCENCANESKNCPQCDKMIIGTVKIFLS